MPASSLILGIDPGLANTGWGIVAAHQTGVRGPVAVAYGVITTQAGQSLSARLSAIHAGVIDVIERYGPGVCALEGVFFGVNAKAALSLGQARAAAILATAQRNLDLGEYPPATIKNTIVGQGRADKSQMTYMVRQLLGLDHDPRPDHCADALAVALTHLTLSGRLARLSQTKRRTMSECVQTSVGGALDKEQRP
jgi:crossover junction endodeoxyribonuclease RuvC